MKNLVIALISAVFSASVLCVSAQNPETTMKQIMEEAMIFVDTIESHNYEIVRMEFDLVTSSKAKETFRLFSSDYTYSIWVFGDYRFSDIDVTVDKDTGSGWEQITQDNTSDSDALISFKPAESGMFRINIISKKFKDNYTVGHYGLIIFH